MDIEYFLGEGRFTQRDEEVRRALAQALSIGEGKNSLDKITWWLNNAITPPGKSEKDIKIKYKEFRKRTASKIIHSKRSNTCSDYAIVFLALTREAGIPAKYVETIEEENLRFKPSNPLATHSFTEVFTNGDWQIYDPCHGIKSEYTCANKPYIKVGEGLDFSCLFLEGKEGVFSIDNMKKLKELRDNYKFS